MIVCVKDCRQVSDDEDRRQRVLCGFFVKTARWAVSVNWHWNQTGWLSRGLFS